MKNIAILGSTGSIGQNTLEVIDQLGDDYRVHSLAAKTQVDKLAEQARRYHPRQLAMGGNGRVLDELRDLIEGEEVALIAGDDALVELAQDPEVDIVVNALVGAVGLRATLAALKAGKVVALANKESIVMAGSLVMEAASGSDGLLIPVDSEHSAVLQCLRGENPNQVRHLILTASGGPFLRTPYDRFADLTPEEALKHPNWEMGPKITIDSATMMNKGLEVIEAHYLFSLPPDRIQVVIHPQSVVHSLVEFIDGSLKAQLSMPDMRIPIQYALTYPDRQVAEFVQNDLAMIGSLDFEAPDLERFPCLKLAFASLESGNGYPAVLNAANEIAVDAFLSHRITFTRIPLFIEAAMDAFKPPSKHDLYSIIEIDRWAREWTREQLKLDILV